MAQDKIALIKEVLEKQACKGCFYPDRNCKYFGVLKSFFPQYDCRRSVKKEVLGVFAKLLAKWEADDLPPTAEEKEAKKAALPSEAPPEMREESAPADEPAETEVAEPEVPAEEASEAPVAEPPEAPAEEPEKKPKRRRRKKKADSE